MNVRLDPRILESFAEALSPRGLLFDEPIFSYVARQAKLAVTRTRESVITELFGNGRARVCRPLHTDFDYFAEHVLGSSQHSDELIAHHGLLTFYRPFAAPTRFAETLERAKGSPSACKLEPTLRRSLDIFRATPAACICCIRADKASDGFAHYRRSHLVQAVTHCPEHQTPLIERCLNCGAPFSHWELPSLVCHHCDRPIAPDSIVASPNEHTASVIRLSQFCAAVLAGEVAWFSESRRLAAYRRRTAEVVRNRSGVVGDNLARHLEQAFGRNLLDTLGLSPHRAPTLGWPALLIHGRLLVDDPIANCLVLAALFESPSHYAEFITSQDSPSVEMETPRRQLNGVQGITPPLVRDALRLPLLRLAAAKHETSYGDLKQWIGAYPGLSERRNARHRRNKLATSKRALIDLLASSPDLSRSGVTKIRKGALKFVLRHDPKWLDEALPKRCQIGKPRGTEEMPAEQIPDDDLQARNRLQELLSDELTAPTRPVRRTSQRLLRLSGLQRVAQEARSAFPETLALIHQSVENEETYYRRRMRWAANDLRRAYSRCDNLIEVFVHAQIPLKFVRSLDRFAKTLIDK